MLIAVLLAAYAFAQTTEAPFQPIAFLMGEWVGEGGGKPGDSTGWFSFALDLDKKIAVRKNHADLKNGVHDDLMVAYADPGRKGLRAIYWDNEGHVINYVVESVADGVRFLSDPAAPGPRYRLTYKKTGQKTISIQFDIAPPGKPDAFAPYISASARRK
jgi:hypothetical protein